ncbi:MAG: peptide ABC transporter permease, partial [Desulforhopalus sp.]
MNKAALSLLFTLFLAMHTCLAAAVYGEETDRTVADTVRVLSGLDSRATGSKGYEKASEYIEKRFTDLGLDPRTYLYDLPVRRFIDAELSVEGKNIPLTPFIYNAITPEATDGTLSGPLFYVGKGTLQDLDGIPVKDSIVLIDFDSARNWQLLPSLGAKALIFLQDKKNQGRIFYTEKEELTPLQFPCFWMTRTAAEKAFGPLRTGSKPMFQEVRLQSSCVWEKFQAKNIYAVIEGTDPKLQRELLVVEAFFDNEEFIFGNSPGAD